MAQPIDVYWRTCEQAGCIGIRLAKRRTCLAHASPEERAAALRRVGKTGEIDGSGPPMTTELLRDGSMNGTRNEPAREGGTGTMWTVVTIVEVLIFGGLLAVLQLELDARPLHRFVLTMFYVAFTFQLAWATLRGTVFVRYSKEPNQRGQLSEWTAPGGRATAVGLALMLLGLASLAFTSTAAGGTSRSVILWYASSKADIETWIGNVVVVLIFISAACSLVAALVRHNREDAESAARAAGLTGSLLLVGGLILFVRWLV
ncbi:hypothetical protein EV652_12189 [Kribbella steppae]|uniref:Uncharacterized protein n=1 Tax=Kribbella steppae TaxID=2512223 RepID=A0A4R2GYQ0_9ACTN|nr:hypothetical protein [Kribbella steppae]TCO15716.1 hypothetical protein EV652_12189 [Kribbella steppae]